MKRRLWNGMAGALACSALLACGSSSSDDEGDGGDGAGGHGSHADGGDGGGNNGSGGGGFVIPDGGIMDALGPDATCGGDTVEATVKQVNMLLVIDQSGSMSETLGSGNRWDAMTGALTAALNGTKDSIDFGLDLFPSELCSVPSEPELAVAVEDGATGVPKILAALDAAGPVENGGTPTAAALARAADYFETGPGSSLEGDSYVLLATDGGPNCNPEHAPCGANACTVNMEGACPIANCCDGIVSDCLDDDATTAQIERLATAGVHTFVVGIPGSQAFAAALNAFAVAGEEPRSGTTKYYDVEDQAELADTFAGITKSLVKSCDLQLTSQPRDNNKLNVYVDDELVLKGPEGWDLDTSTMPPTIHLLGPVCEAVETTGVEKVRVVFGCPTQVVK